MYCVSCFWIVCVTLFSYVRVSVQPLQPQSYLLAQWQCFLRSSSCIRSFVFIHLHISFLLMWLTWPDPALTRRRLATATRHHIRLPGCKASLQENKEAPRHGGCDDGAWLASSHMTAFFISSLLYCARKQESQHDIHLVRSHSSNTQNLKMKMMSTFVHHL